MNKTLSMLTPIVLALAAALVLVASTHAQTPVPPTGKITVTGQIANGTPGGTLPVTTTLMLHAYDGETMSGMTPGEADSTGQFRFENVETAQGRTFEVMASVGRATYFSPQLAPSPGQIAQTSVTIYETTTDASQVSVEQMHTFVEFIGETWMRVNELYLLSNEGNRAVEGAIKAGDGTPATLRFSLPVGATNVQFDEGHDSQRFVQAADGFVDTWALPPGKGSSQFIVSYVLPYNGQAHLEMTLNYPTRGLNVILPDTGIELTSAQLQSQGIKQTNDGTSVRLFASGGLAAGQSVSFDLSGKPRVTQPAPMGKTPASDNSLGLLMGGLALGLALIAGGLVWLRATMRPQPVKVELDFETQRNALIQAMADLDDDLAAGIVAEAERDRQRRLLRAELVALLEQQRPVSIEP